MNAGSTFKISNNLILNNTKSNIFFYLFFALPNINLLKKIFTNAYIKKESENKLIYKK